MPDSASSSSAAQGSAPTGPPPSHPAFPSLIPSHLRTAPVAPSVPTTPAQVLKLINSCSSPHAVATNLIPSLAAVASASKASEKDKEKAQAKGEEILALFETDLGKLSKEEVEGMAAGLVFVVSARTHPNHADQKGYNADLLTLASDLCMIGNRDQLYDCGPRLADLAWGILRLSKHLRTVSFRSLTFAAKAHWQVESALPPLQALMRRAIPSTSLSGVHAAYLEACLLTHQYEAALEYIDMPYVEVKSMAPTYLDVITFYHHAGLIMAAIQNWGLAVEMFSIAVTVPTTAASAIQLSCAKRAILCGLLDDGKLIHFPKYIAGSVSRLVERNAKEYVKLAEAFMAGKWSDVRGFVGTKEFKDDCNIGLLEQVIFSIPVRQVLKIKALYSRMRISDLAQRLDINGEGAEAEVLGLLDYMVRRGLLRASIDQSSGSAIVSFAEEDTDYTSPSALASLKRANHLAAWLETELTKGGRELGVNRDYLKKQASSIENAGKGGGGKGGGGDDLDDFMSGGMSSGRLGATGKSKIKGVGSKMDDMGF